LVIKYIMFEKYVYNVKCLSAHFMPKTGNQPCNLDYIINVKYQVL